MRFRLLLTILPFLLAVGTVWSQDVQERVHCVTRPNGYVTRCGYVSLPQDYEDPDGGNVEIYYTQIKSRNPEAQPDPLVYLVGGPGSSGTQLLQISFQAYLRAFIGDRDIIVIDQRGTGFSNPPLYCREALYRFDEILQIPYADHAELMLEILTECRQRLSENSVQFDSFHSENNARDIVNVMLALGYEQWNLVGVSYGSRLGLVMMRDYPQYVRSAILDSVYPPQADIYLDAYFSGERALQALFDACEAAESCRARYPNLEENFFRLYERLNRYPLTVGYRLPGNKTLKIEVSGYRLYDWVFSWLYEVESIRVIPLLLYQLARGMPENAVYFGVAHQALMTSLSLGMHYTVQCQEEYGSAADRSYERLLQEHSHLESYMQYPVEGRETLAQLCDLWLVESRVPRANMPVTSEVPALLLSGNYDPITPPDYAAQAEETLTTAYNFVLPHVGHGVLRSDECAVEIAVAFIEDPLSGPDSSCIAETKEIEFR